MNTEEQAARLKAVLGRKDPDEIIEVAGDIFIEVFLDAAESLKRMTAASESAAHSLERIAAALESMDRNH